MFSNPTGKPLTPCTQERLLVSGDPSERLWKAGAAITSAEGTTCRSGALACGVGTLQQFWDSVPSLPRKDLLPVGWTCCPASLPCWVFDGFSATLVKRSLGPYSSSQKSQGHTGCGTWGLWGESHSQDLSFEHVGPLVHPLPTSSQSRTRAQKVGLQVLFLEQGKHSWLQHPHHHLASLREASNQALPLLPSQRRDAGWLHSTLAGAEGTSCVGVWSGHFCPSPS